MPIDTTSAPFQVGDTIEAIGNCGVLRIGILYVVKEMYLEEGKWLVNTDTIGAEGYFARRFKLVEKKKKSKTSLYLLNGNFTLTRSKPYTFPKKGRMAVSQLYRFRKQIAAVYKFSPQSAQKIKDLRVRMNTLQNDPVEYILKNTKTNIEVAYSTKNKLRAVHDYMTLLQAQRNNARELNETATQTGLLTISGIHTKPNQIYSLYLSTVLSKAKVPQTAVPHVGIEIECMLPTDWDKTKLLPYAKKISLISDGSIDNVPSGYMPQEIRFLTTEGEYENDIKALAGILQELKAQVNKTCGLHVHLDMRNIDQELVKQRFVNLVKSQKYLQGLVPAERRENRYCKPTRNLNPFEHVERYKAINGQAYLKYQTLEIRLHHGSLDGTEITNWVTLLLAIIKADPIKRASPTVKGFLDKVKANEEIKKYVEETIAKNTPVVFDDDITTVGNTWPTSRGCGHWHEGCETVCLNCGRTWGNHDDHACRGIHRGEHGRFDVCEGVPANV